MFAEREYKYDQLRNTTEGCGSSPQDAPASSFPRLRSAFFASSTPWIISTVVFALLSAVLAIGHGYRHADVGTFDTGFSTDIGISDRPPIRVVQRRFVGTPRFYSNGTGYQTAYSRYAGEPRPEIDQAWQDLIGQRYWIIQEQEAQQMFGPTYKQFELPGGKYAAGIDVLHQLHCLNTLRKYADADYYAKELEEEHGYTRLHLGELAEVPSSCTTVTVHGTNIGADHCVDQIRQSLQCSSDRTPIPTRWYPGMGPFVVTDRIHTCRDFDGLRQWMIDKNAF
jgi:hypothetical protein